jgi:hypothetical protein
MLIPCFAPTLPAVHIKLIPLIKLTGATSPLQSFLNGGGGTLHRIGSIVGIQSIGLQPPKKGHSTESEVFGADAEPASSLVITVSLFVHSFE